MWNGVLDILKEKAAQGIDVRLIYDDFGCAMHMPSRFIEEMKGYGIRAVPFNPIAPILSLRQNNRDHRKITVIDGHTGFTGGINLADEYINIGSKFGHWKDTGIMLKGNAVWNLTVMFLQTWRMLTKEDEDYTLYIPMKMPLPATVFISLPLTITLPSATASGWVRCTVSSALPSVLSSTI